MSTVFAFACSFNAMPEWRETIYNARTRGAAKVAHFYMVRESWPDVRFTDVRCRKIGPAHTSADFKRCAAYRGMPDLSCGDRVQAGESKGTVVGHNGSANFEILFDEDSRYRGAVLPVHPSELVRLG